MKILVVEDIASKREEVLVTLREVLEPWLPEVLVAASFITAIQRMSEVAFDILVLDLTIPIRDGEVPDPEGGKKVLREIFSGVECRKPSHILCLTAFEDNFERLREEIDNSLVHLIIYRGEDGRWRESLASKAGYVAKRLQEADQHPDEYKIDLAIITSSPLVELTAVKSLPCPFLGEFHQRDGLYYYTTEWPRVTGRALTVVACAAPKMGMTAAAITACKVIERWRPRMLAMTGIAAATRSTSAFGDILVAEAAFDYGSGKIMEDRGGARSFVPSPNQLDIDAELFAILQRWELEQLRMDEIRRAFRDPPQNVPRLSLGLLASGAAVIQSKQIVDDILRDSRKVVGLDMEGYAIFHASYLAKTPRPRVLVAKSVSDFADRKKSDNWQSYAAFTSARFLYEFFTQCTEISWDA